MVRSSYAMGSGHHNVLPVPRGVKLPVEVRLPEGFDPASARTWPHVDGRLEFVGGRLWYMPPCGEAQQVVVPQVLRLLLEWTDTHGEFEVGGNEAGMILGGETRGADAAVWPRVAPGTQRSHDFRRTAPVLAVEVAGEDESEKEAALWEKARWYLQNGVTVVWLVLPESREVLVVREGSERRYGKGDTVPEDPALPGLTADVNRLFSDLD